MNERTNSEVQQAGKWLRPDQVDALRDVAHETGAPYLRDRNESLVALAYDTGLRVGELVALDVDMLRLDDGELFLPGHIQKDYPNDASPRAVTIELDVDDTIGTVRLLRSYLTNRWKESTALFPSRSSDQITTRGVRNVVKKLAVSADVRPYTLEGSRGDPSAVTPHVLRHSVAYRLLHERDGFTLYDVRNRLRHRSILTTERVYDHFETI